MLAQGLGIPLEFGLDPLTVVARGAAIFAGAQRLEPVEPVQPPPGQFILHLEYKPIATDAEPWVGGTVRGCDGQRLEGYTVELVESKTQWRSGRIQLGENGSFMTNVRVEKGRANEFLIELCDATGIRCEMVPDRLTITTHSVGVALADRRVQHFLTKGTALPARRREIHRTTVALSRGQSGSVLRIPIVEGEKINRDDRNRLIGHLEVAGPNVRRDVPVGSEVEITLEIDGSRQVHVTAYIPILDEEFPVNLELEKAAPRPADLAADFRKERDRLDKLREEQRQSGDSAAAAVLQRIDNEDMVAEIETSLRAAEGDRDAANKCQRRLLDLKIALDEAKDALEWPSLVAKAEERLKDAREMVAEHGTPEERARLAALEREMRTAIESRDADSLRHKETEIRQLYVEVLRQLPEFWVGYLNYLVERKEEMSDQALAEQLIEQGTRAMRMDDLPGLKSAVRQLEKLLPLDDGDEDSGFGGTTLPRIAW